MNNRVLNNFLICFLLISGFATAETRSIVPRNPGEGSIGTSEKPWASGYFSNSLTLGQETVTEFPKASSSMYSTNVKFSLNDVVEIPGIVGGIYDDTVLVDESIYFGNGNFSIREMEDWKGNATSLTVSEDGLTGIMDNPLNDKCVSDGIWLYLSNFTTNITVWATNVNAEKREIQWDSSEYDLGLGGTSWNIEKVSPIIQKKEIGIVYGKDVTNDFTTTEIIFNLPFITYQNFAAENETTLYYCTQASSNVYKSIDGGMTWKQLENSNIYTGNNLHEISVFHDIIYVSVRRNCYKSEDAGKTWRQINFPSVDSDYSICTVDGILTYAVGSNGILWKSVDGGESWIQVNLVAQLPSAQNYLKTKDGQTMYVYPNNGHKLYKSLDSGYSWTTIDSSPTTPNIYWTYGQVDNNTLFYHAYGTNILKSVDGGVTWNSVPGTPVFPSGASVRPAMCSPSDKCIFFASRNNQVMFPLFKIVPKSTSSTSNTYYTTILEMKTNGISRLNDIVFTQNGKNIFYSFETGPDEWSIFDQPKNDWSIIAKKENNVWNVRNTESSILVSTPATTASEAISIALETNILNRVDAFTYNTQQHGYFTTANDNLAVALTFYVLSSNSTNTPQAVATMFDYGTTGEMQENMKDYEVVLDSTENKTTVTKTGEVDSNTMIYYIRNKDDDYMEEQP